MVDILCFFVGCGDVDFYILMMVGCVYEWLGDWVVVVLFFDCVV